MSTTFLHCKYFVKRKKRYCKMLVKSGEEYCGEHQMSSSLTKARIPCPLDPKHTVYTNKLQSHLRICNARVTTVPSYIEKNINVGQMEYSSASDMLSPYQILSTLPKNKVLEVITKINNIYQNNVHISEKFLSFPVVEQELECHSEYGNKTRKHLKQTSAILGYLNECDMLKADTCFIEFGAGRGQLSCWIAEATTQLNNCKILLIERASPKHKRDNKLSKTSDRIQRIRADIADLVLEKLEVFSTVKNVIGITKHLCGSATDLAIRCMVQSTLTKCKSTSLLFTFCCHHKCTWTTYTGKNFFQENNLCVEDFNIICGLTSWATCGTGLSREYRENVKIDVLEDENAQVERYDFNRIEKEEIGRKCKNIINWGRFKYLEENGFQCSLHYYCDKEITPENVCILAI